MDWYGRFSTHPTKHAAKHTGPPVTSPQPLNTDLFTGHHIATWWYAWSWQKLVRIWLPCVVLNSIYKIEFKEATKVEKKSTIMQHKLMYSSTCVFICTYVPCIRIILCTQVCICTLYMNLLKAWRYSTHMYHWYTLTKNQTTACAKTPSTITWMNSIYLCLQ